MQISLLGILAILIAMPMLTFKVYRSLYVYEWTQIALDNAAITMGTEDRDLFRFVYRMNHYMKTLETGFHHPVHACALVPVTAEVCQPIDQEYHQFLRQWKTWLRTTVEYKWQKSRLDGIVKLSEVSDIPVTAHLERGLTAPVKVETCPICEFDVYLEVDSAKTPIRSSLRSTSKVDVESHEELIGKSLMQEDWNYRLWPGKIE